MYSGHDAAGDPSELPVPTYLPFFSASSASLRSPPSESLHYDLERCGVNGSRRSQRIETLAAVGRIESASHDIKARLRAMEERCAND
jgi:hypothetical protein